MRWHLQTWATVFRMVFSKESLKLFNLAVRMRERSTFGSRVLREGIIFTNKDLYAVRENKMSTKENLWDLHLPLSLIYSLSTVSSFIITVYFLAITCLWSCKHFHSVYRRKRCFPLLKSWFFTVLHLYKLLMPLVLVPSVTKKPI